MIMAAGVGSRLMPLTETIPKPMVPIVNKPVMEYCIRLLQHHKITNIVANTHYIPHLIEDYFLDGKGYNVNLSYSYEKDLLGTAGGVKNNKGFLNETFCIVSGDALTNIDLSKMYAFHKEKKALASLALKSIDDVSQYGVVVADQESKIIAFQEKPDKKDALSNWVNTGIYILEPEIFDYIPKGFYDFGKNLFPKLVELNERIFGFNTDDYWCDVGNIDVYKQANWDVLSGKYTLGNLELKSVERNTNILQPELLNSTVVGDYCEIAENVRIFNSIILQENIIGKNVKIINSVIGPNCYIGEDAIIRSNVIYRSELCC